MASESSVQAGYGRLQLCHQKQRNLADQYYLERQKKIAQGQVYIFCWVFIYYIAQSYNTDKDW